MRSMYNFFQRQDTKRGFQKESVYNQETYHFPHLKIKISVRANIATNILKIITANYYHSSLGSI